MCSLPKNSTDSSTAVPCSNSCGPALLPYCEEDVLSSKIFTWRGRGATKIASILGAKVVAYRCEHDGDEALAKEHSKNHVSELIRDAAVLATEISLDDMPHVSKTYGSFLHLLHRVLNELLIRVHSKADSGGSDCVSVGRRVGQFVAATYIRQVLGSDSR